jgi:hypothetical protein
MTLEQVLVVDRDDTKLQKNSFWAAEQLLRSGVFSAVVLWLDATGDERQQRRLQLAAEHGKAWGVCYRPASAARHASPAGLRMLLQHHDDGLHLDIIKNRGGRLREVTLDALAPKSDTGSHTGSDIHNDTDAQTRPLPDAVTYLHQHRDGPAG